LGRGMPRPCFFEQGELVVEFPEVVAEEINLDLWKWSLDMT